MIRTTHYERHRELFQSLEQKIKPLVDSSNSLLGAFAKADGEGHRGAMCSCVLIDCYIRKSVTHDIGIEELYASKPVKEIVDLLSRVNAFGKEADLEITTVIYRNWQYARHEMDGKRVYDVSPGLADRLLATELRGLKGSDLRLPFRSIYVLIPPRANLKIHHWITGMHDVEGVYITEFVSSRGRSWSILLCGKENKEGAKFFEEFKEDNKGDPYLDKATDDCLFSYNIPLPDDKPLDGILDDFFNGQERINKIKEKYSEEIFRSFKFLLNVVMYSTCSDVRCEIKSSKDRAKLQEKLNALPKSPKHKKKRAELLDKMRQTPEYRRIVLGNHLRPWDKKDSVEKDGTTPRVLVQGHHKNQACGVGRKGRKRIWIEPYWRGDFEHEGPEKERRVLNA